MQYLQKIQNELKRHAPHHHNHHHNHHHRNRQNRHSDPGSVTKQNVDLTGGSNNSRNSTGTSGGSSGGVRTTATRVAPSPPATNNSNIDNSARSMGTTSTISTVQSVASTKSNIATTTSAKPTKSARQMKKEDSSRNCVLRQRMRRSSSCDLEKFRSNLSNIPSFDDQSSDILKKNNNKKWDIPASVSAEDAMALTNLEKLSPYSRKRSCSFDKNLDLSEKELKYDAKTRLNLAEINLKNGDLDKAQDNMSQCLVARVHLYGKDHPDVGIVHEKMGDLGEVKKEVACLHYHYDAALRIAMVTGNDAGFYRILYKKAESFRKAKHRYDALKCIGEASAKVKRTAGVGVGERGGSSGSNSKSSDQRETLDSLTKMGLMALDLGNDEVAMDLFQAVTKTVDTTKGATDDFASIYYVMGLTCEKKSEYDNAMDYFGRAHAMYQSSLGLHPDVAKVLTHMGFVQFNRCNYDDAINKYNEALGVMKKTGMDVKDMMPVLRDLVLIRRKTNQLALAVDAYKFVLGAVAKDEDRGNTEEVATVLHQLGHLHVELCNVKDAIKAFKKEGKVRSKLGNDQRQIVNLLLEIGEFNIQREEHDSALKYFEEAVTEFAQAKPNPSLQSTNLDKPSTVSNRARARNEQIVPPSPTSPPESPGSPTTDKRVERLCVKLKECERRLRTQDRIGYFLNPLDFADSINNMGNLYLTKGDHDSAISCYEFSVRMRMSAEEALTVEECIEANYNLTKACYKSESYEDALRVCEIVLKKQEQYRIKDNAVTAKILNQMGNIHVKGGMYTQALGAYERALLIKKATFGDEHEEVLGTQANIGAALVAMGSNMEAVEYLREVLTLSKSSMGVVNPHAAMVLHLIGTAHMNEGEYNYALRSLRHSLDIRQKVLGGSDVKVGKTMADMALAHMAVKEYRAAHQMCREALKIFTQAGLSRNHQYMREIKDRILQLESTLANEEHAGREYLGDDNVCWSWLRF